MPKRQRRKSATSREEHCSAHLHVTDRSSVPRRRYLVGQYLAFSPKGMVQRQVQRHDARKSEIVNDRNAASAEMAEGARG
eukprot:4714553-Pleurochrysis_carterae.AAC.1